VGVITTRRHAVMINAFRRAAAVKVARPVVVITRGRHVLTIMTGRRVVADIAGDACVVAPVVVRVLARVVVLAREFPLVHRRPSFRVMTDRNLFVRTL
jgi:hypothetical protein